MKKKLFILIILLLSLTGCKVEYKLNLDNKLNLDENIELISTSEEDKEKFDSFDLYIPIDKNVPYIAFQEKIEETEYYKTKKNSSKITFKNSYSNQDYEKYINSYIANSAYDYVSITSINNEDLVLSSSKKFYLFDKFENLEEVKITISTTYKVIEHNADEVNNHDYKWIINKENADNKGIFLEINPSKETLTFMEKLIRGDYFNTFVITLIFLVIGILIYLILKKCSEKRDEI